ncbi:tetratricopeptide (TPR) repeat protein [Rhizomicrobium palustre]|uniref:Tetratricopeptide (TPR) repeat protein n=1 Tax=Rhizomicrobium palustre TaxID=189966 RepID=A0A846N3S9_9PROT|nr:hypothetical protein [Rhizomicrobium palustre]NIK90386.1 tetratricopeptide (TPR) repeat protein [Rhizomicrobium palustre]
MPNTLLHKAQALHRAGNIAAALEAYRDAALSGDAACRAHCLRHIGDLALTLGLAAEAEAALSEAETLYRNTVPNSLALANTLRLRALLTGAPAQWRAAKAAYHSAAAQTGLDLRAAFDECDAHLAPDGQASKD